MEGVKNSKHISNSSRGLKMKATLTIRTRPPEPHASHLILSLAPDNTPNIQTKCQDETCTVIFQTEKITTMIAALDDYLLNLKIANETARKEKTHPSRN